MSDKVTDVLAPEAAEIRRMAVIALGMSEDADVSIRLVEGLGDPSWRVREEAVRVGALVAERLDMFPALIDAICQGDNIGLRNASIAVMGAAGDVAQRALETALGEVDQGAKKFIIEAVAVAGGDRAAGILAAELASEDSNIIAAVIDALGVAGGTAAEHALLDVLARDEPFQRMAALDALNRLQAPVPWGLLFPLLDDRLVWRVAIKALGRCDTRAAVPHLLSALEDSSESVVSDATRALDELCAAVPEARDQVAEYMQQCERRLCRSLAGLAEHSELLVRQGAVLLLALARDPVAIDGLLGLMREEVLPPSQMDAAVRWGGEAVELLLDRQARVAATERGLALQLAAELCERHVDAGRLSAGGPTWGRLLAEIRRALFGQDTEHRVAAASVMAPFADRTDAEALVTAAVGTDLDLSDACAPALLHLSHREPDAVRHALAQIDLATCAQDYVAELVAQLDGVRALGRLHGAMLGDDPAARAAAISGLALVGGQEAAQWVAVALHDENLFVQLRAASALGLLASREGDVHGVQPLLDSIQNASPSLQSAVARALGVAGDAVAVAPLRKLLSIQDASVQVEALSSLCSLGAPDSAALLIGALIHRDAEVVKQALELLFGVSPEEARPHLEAALSSERWDIRQVAVRLLGGYVDATQQLRQALATETDELVRGDIEIALQRNRTARQ